MEDQNQHKSYQLHQTHFQFHHPSSTNVLVDNAVAETRDRDRELYEKHQFYAQQESGFQLRDLCSQLQTENCGPISENGRKRRCCSVGELCTPSVRRNASVRSGGNKARTDVGQIVEVQGGHIVRGAGGKDRHSKVCTAKGTRDRRVRLSADTAIEFYDVQDRLGFDRPSKAVDWLIQNAKAAIDELHHLPAWSPTSLSVSDVKRRRLGLSVGSENVNGASLLPPSLGPDSVKSFFPMGGEVSSITATQHQIEFQAYAHGGGGNGDCSSIRQSEDLRLSLQSLQAAHHRNGTTAHDEQQHSVFAGAVPVEFQNPNTGWAKSDSQPSLELGRLHKLLAGWQNQQSHNTSIDQHCHSDSGDEGGPTDAIGDSRLMFEQPPLLQPLFDDQYSPFFTQREPLQSSDMPLIRDWFSDPSITTTSEQHIEEISVHSQGLTGLGFPSGGFSGLQFPGRIQDEEEHDYDLKPAVLSSDSCH